MSAETPKPWSIRQRLRRRVLAWVILAWFATIALALAFLDYELNELFDGELESLAETVVLALEGGPERLIARSIGIVPGDGERILRILPDGAPPPPAPWPELHGLGFHEAAGWRILRVAADHGTVELAHNMAWRREELFEAASALLILILPLIGLLLWALGRHLREGFAPIETLSRAIGARAPEDLTPIATQALPEELRPLVEDMNQYLARIEALRRSERQFIANASHELRTPLAAIRAGLDGSQAPEAQASLLRVDALSRRVERLLQLSRSQSGLGLTGAGCDLIQIIALLRRDLTRPPRKPIHFDDGDFESYWLHADADAIAILLRNLMENAVEHGSGAVWLKLSGHHLSISNPTDAADFRLEPFDKGAGSAGMGLGLSIVAQLCESLKIGFSHHQEPGHLRIELDLGSLRRAP